MPALFFITVSLGAVDAVAIALGFGLLWSPELVTWSAIGLDKATIRSLIWLVSMNRKFWHGNTRHSHH